MNEEKNVFKKTHNIIMENRGKISVSGVDDVESFDEQGIVLMTSQGVLTITGEDLHMNTLNVESGDIIIDGEINSLLYTDNEQEKQNTSFLSRLFK